MAKCVYQSILPQEVDKAGQNLQMQAVLSRRNGDHKQQVNGMAVRRAPIHTAAKRQC